MIMAALNPQFWGNALYGIGGALSAFGAPRDQRAQAIAQTGANFQNLLEQQRAQRDRDFLLNYRISQDAREEARRREADEAAKKQRELYYNLIGQPNPSANPQDMRVSDRVTYGPNMSQNPADIGQQSQYTPQQIQFLQAAGPEAGMAILAQQAFPKPNEAPSAIQEYEYAKRQGYGGTYEQWQVDMANAKRPTTNINMPSPLTPDQVGQSKFGEEAAKANVEMFASAVKGGQSAARSLGDIKMLGALAKTTPTGAGQPIINATASYAKRLGIDVSDVANLPAAQQMEAIVARIVPNLRPPGSGTTSDRDLALFQASLPSLVNTPQGNQAIVANLEKIAKRSMEEAAIADKALAGQITPSQARKEISDLGPLDLMIPQSPSTSGNNFNRNDNSGKVLIWNPATGKLE